MRNLFIRSPRDKSGAAVVEFALILPGLCLTLLAFFDLGYRAYLAAILQGAMHEAARMSTVGNKTPAEIDTYIKDRLRNLSRDGAIVVVTRSYSDFSGVEKPEKITQDTMPVNEYNSGDCFEDANGNGTYDLDRGTLGVGGSEDIVHYTVGITFDRIVPLGRILGWSDREEIGGSTVLRNQPFAGRNTGVAVVCA